MIIGINGYSGSGKDTIGAMIQLLYCHNLGGLTIEEIMENQQSHEWWMQDQSGWEIKKWAGKLKTIASLLTGIPAYKFEDQEFKKTKLGPEWNWYSEEFVEQGVYRKVEHQMTVRDLLQRLGTEGLRNGLHTNVWINALMSDYKCVPADRAPNGWDCDNWIITDTRFPNEAQAIKDAGGIVIRVDRPGVKPVNPHPSETSLDDWDFDHKIMNGSDLVSLIFTVNTILKKENLLSNN